MIILLLLIFLVYLIQNGLQHFYLRRVSLLTVINQVIEIKPTLHVFHTAGNHTAFYLRRW